MPEYNAKYRHLLIAYQSLLVDNAYRKEENETLRHAVHCLLKSTSTAKPNKL